MSRATRGTPPAREADPASEAKSGALGAVSPRSEATADPPQSDGRRHCAASRRDGQPCRSFPGFADDRCLAHSETPEAMDARAAGAAKGGRHHSNLARALRIVSEGPWSGVAGVLADAIAETYRGSLDPKRGHAIASLARSLVAISDAALVDARLESIESQLAAIRSGDEAEIFLRPGGQTP